MALHFNPVPLSADFGLYYKEAALLEDSLSFMR